MTMNPISRRTVLKGLGVSVALPALEAMVPGLAYTATNAAAPATPKRLAFLYVPNGINMAEWTPPALGPGFPLTRTLQPLAPFKDDLNVLSGLTLDKARPHGDGGGDHARAMSAFLTGCQPVKTDGADIRVGRSADQVVADHVGRATRFASLEIGCEGGRLSGNCDSGYSCAYSSNLSWRTPNTPNPKEVNPRAVFDRLFGDQRAGASASRRDQYNLSVLDFVAEDANSLMNRLGGNDRRRLDEYLSSIRDVERRLVRADQTAAEDEGPVRMARPTGVPNDFGEYVRVMSDLLVLAFRTDATRVATFVFANEGSNRSYREVNIREGHHSLSHHQNDRAKLEQLARINHYHVTQLAYLVRELKAVREPDGSTLLDNSLLVYGSGNSDGNRHNHDELPILLIGRGGGTVQTGRHLRFPRETPITNLYLSLFDRLGVPHVERHGDSTGRLSQLS